ncbi:4-phosphoerythronate dehydrogenase, partial [bacterium]|nr:4-phosphoerythronate dehydrogenase [bacterium]
MKIVADENIPYVKEAFGSLGDVIPLPGRKIAPASVVDAEILLVRSITEVNASLLEGSRVRFVGTATIGTDHVDEEYLHSRGIAFASAPGSNANSVAEYVVAALLTTARRKNFPLKGKTIGVIGVGNCGSRVAKKAEALGMRVLLNDPPLWRQTGNKRFRPLEELFSADILTLHVPLTYEGIDATYHLVDEAFLSKLRPECILMNTSRGPVVDNLALATA